MTLQQLHAWHVARAAEALGQVRIRLPSFRSATPGARSPRTLGVIEGLTDLADFHLRAAELLQLAIEGS